MTNLSLSERKEILRLAVMEELMEESVEREPTLYYLVYTYRECNFDLILN